MYFEKIETVEQALKVANQAEIEGLLGLYPKALRVLAKHIQENPQWQFVSASGLPDDDVSVIVAIGSEHGDQELDIAHHDTERGGWVGDRSNRLINDPIVAWRDWPDYPELS